MECIIRNWKTSDAVELAEAINNKNVLKNLRDGLPYPYTVKDAESYICAMLNADKHDNFAFAIECGGKVIGSIGAFRQSNIHRFSAEVGYYIAEPYWREGLGSSALKQLCAYIFLNTDIIRLYAEPFSCNAASCGILEKCGFVFEGTLKSNAFKEGKFLNMNMYALIKS